MYRLCGLILICWHVALATNAARAVETSTPMLETDIGGVHVQAAKLFATTGQVGLLGRDGRLWSVPPQSLGNPVWSHDPFRPYTASDMKSRLEKEMGDRFEVVNTRHFVVAFPRGQRDVWPQRFEDLYTACVHYFSVRGFTPTEPEFPMVAIVWHNRDEFHQAAQREGTKIGEEIIGFYWQVSNRLMMYDLGNAARGKNWRETAETIIHEATHQTAFNVGIHRRFTPTPSWVGEGLATMFEAKGVYDAHDFPERANRVNTSRLAEFRQFQKTKRTKDSIQDLLTSDRRFQENPSGAYAEAWALTFFLVETMPREYAKYLQITAERLVFQTYSPADRYADFVSVFGQDFTMLDARLTRFINELK